MSLNSDFMILILSEKLMYMKSTYLFKTTAAESMVRLTASLIRQTMA